MIASFTIPDLSRLLQKLPEQPPTVSTAQLINSASLIEARLSFQEARGIVEWVKPYAALVSVFIPAIDVLLELLSSAADAAESGELFALPARNGIRISTIPEDKLVSVEYRPS